MNGDWRSLISQPQYGIKEEKDIMVSMRDGTRLAVDVFVAHEYLALKAEERRDRRSCHPVLACPGLSYQARLSHRDREKPLAERIIYLVRACVEQILSLQINFSSSGMRGKTIGSIKHRRTAGVIFQILPKLRPERLIVPGF